MLFGIVAKTVFIIAAFATNIRGRGKVEGDCWRQGHLEMPLGRTKAT
jgi:hypothetical protein